ncbi:MAG: hypothetical protein EOP09_05995, partial [Proteobacteria bacterium]
MRSESLSVGPLGVSAAGLALGGLVTLGVAMVSGDAGGANAGAALRTISVDEIKDGMKGYGLTVFKGTEPERFDVEVVGVLRNFRPGQELILVKTP